ncbi:hypothetical protein EVAR_36827_1 [Eumeta japonica]|uniref:Uncharacterized protein n=1 Tax=Eumeta variegata TaxID=151549 RepID=A0A4C1WBG8_EUMVA|nr:hypothetical protein EVAR_36827_1 [Eumeta japonica]
MRVYRGVNVSTDYFLVLCRNEAKKVCGVKNRTNVSKKYNEWWNFEVKKVVNENKKAWLDLLSVKGNHRVQREDILKVKLKDTESRTSSDGRVGSCDSENAESHVTNINRCVLSGSERGAARARRRVLPSGRSRQLVGFLSTSTPESCAVGHELLIKLSLGSFRIVLLAKDIHCDYTINTKQIQTDKHYDPRQAVGGMRRTVLRPPYSIGDPQN